jgi:CBS domain-containing protein
MRLQDVMKTKVETIEADAPADGAWHLMRSRGLHHLVVTDGPALVGILSDRDLGGGRGTELRQGKQVRDLMTPDVVDAPPRTTLRQAANRMRGLSIGCLVVREDGELRGIVTVSDLLEQLGRGAEKAGATAERRTLAHRGMGRKPGGTGKARRH